MNDCQNEARLEFQKMKKEASTNLTGFDWDSYNDENLARQAKFYFSSGSNITDEMLMEVSSIIVDNTSLFFCLDELPSDCDGVHIQHGKNLSFSRAR